LADVSPRDPGGAAEECDPVPSAHASLPEDDGGHHGGAESLDDDRPVHLDEIDRTLRESADVARADRAAPIRAWRDSLRRFLEVLIYARSVLSDDVGILRHRLATDAPSSKEILDDLPAVLAARSWGEGWSGPDEPPDAAALDLDVFPRADVLLAVHAEMASIDLTSSQDARRVLALLEEQVAALVTRQHAVEARLQEIRTVIVRQYQEGVIPTEGSEGSR
jgi:hypothetical protein